MRAPGVIAPPAPAASSPGRAPVAEAPEPATAATLTPPFAESGPVEALDAQHGTILASIGAKVDTLDYFELLHVDKQAAPSQIKKAFYRWSRIYHPDRFFHIPEGPARTAIGHIYKRVTEAYSVLKDGPKRAKYLTDVTGPNRAQRLRYTEATEAELKAEAKKAQEEEIGTNPKARGFYTQAVKDFDRGDFSSAERNLKMAITYESGNQRYKEKLAETVKKLDEKRQKSGDSFKIK